MQSNETQASTPQARHRTLTIIWGAIFMSITLLFLLATFVAPDSPQAQAEGNRTMTIVFAALGASTAMASILLRQRLTTQAIERQQPQQLSSAYIISFALCESAALFGLLIRFTTGDRYYYLLFIIAVAGLLLNLPRQSDIVNASSGRRM
jgi:F0F1-type ATP synthase membrane subunit c/vacuolar-type H+-ATPase subunit K